MATWLILSVRRWLPETPVALVTDSPECAAAAKADIVIEARADVVDAFAHKLWLDWYNPFDQAVFLDADTLVLRNPGDIWTRYGAQAIGIFGGNTTSGRWWVDVTQARALVGSESFPLINSGFLRFDRSERAAAFFKSSRRWFESYEDLQPVRLRDQWPDEPALALAMAEHGIRALDDFSDETYRTTVHATSVLADPIRGRSRLTTKQGNRLSPAILHFATYTESTVYHRAGLRLERRAAPPWWRKP